MCVVGQLHQGVVAILYHIAGSVLVYTVSIAAVETQMALVGEAIFSSVDRSPRLIRGLP